MGFLSRELFKLGFVKIAWNFMYVASHVTTYTVVIKKKKNFLHDSVWDTKQWNFRIGNHFISKHLYRKQDKKMFTCIPKRAPFS